MIGYVYILRSIKDKKRYIGSTNNIDRRLKEHNTGLVYSTRYRRPFKTEAILKYDTIIKAAEMEKKFKQSHDCLEREIKKQKILISEYSSDG